jgi:hypothetical protein
MHRRWKRNRQNSGKRPAFYHCVFGHAWTHPVWDRSTGGRRVRCVKHRGHELVTRLNRLQTVLLDARRRRWRGVRLRVPPASSWSTAATGQVSVSRCWNRSSFHARQACVCACSGIVSGKSRRRRGGSPGLVVGAGLRLRLLSVASTRGLLTKAYNVADRMRACGGDFQCNSSSSSSSER